MDSSATPNEPKQEDSDVPYEPKKEEIVGYGLYLGMDLKKDLDLFFIAKEGLRAPIPKPWKAI